VIDHLVLAGSAVLDIGANNGFYSNLFAAKVGASGKVIAFEPTPYAYEELCRNVQINGFESRVECHCQALDMREGVATLRVFSGTGGVYNSLSIVRAPTGQLPSEEITVPTVSLDYILGTLCGRFISFIKIDVEGQERNVLAGGQKGLSTIDNTAVMVELHEPAAKQADASVLESLAIMEECGFRPYQFTGVKRIQPLGDTGRKLLLEAKLKYPNILFLKEEPMRFLQKISII
jgi:FkbM family methyltransferase